MNSATHDAAAVGHHVESEPEHDVVRYRENRERLSAADIAPFVGQWVAFSNDGAQLLAGDPDLAELERRLAGSGQDPEQVVFEFLSEDDSFLGGAAIQ